MTYTVGPKGQIVIAKEIRERLGIEPGWMALQRVEDDHLVVYFLPPEHDRSLAGVLAPYIEESVRESLANKDWRDISDAAWEAAARERAARQKEE
jgi:AbrB family looped-hinge helix DNA binding protein